MTQIADLQRNLQHYRKQYPKASILSLLSVSVLGLYALSHFNAKPDGRESLRYTSYDYPPSNGLTAEPPSEASNANSYPAFGPRNLKTAVARAEELWAANVQRRKNFVAAKNGYENIMQFSDKAWNGYGNMFTLWDIFVPSFPCPWETERLGVMADGGKYVCGLPRLQQKRGQKCVIYSVGVEQESSFESELLQRTSCDVFLFDFSVDRYGPQLRELSPEIQARAYFHKVGIGGKDEVVDGNQFYTLGSLMRQNGHDWIDIFKIDVEGAEFQVMPAIIKEFGNGHLPFGQMQMEIHSDKTEKPYDTAQFAEWWEMMEAAGLRAFSSELNYPSIHWLHNPSAMEMNFLNNCNGLPNCGTLLRD